MRTQEILTRVNQAIAEFGENNISSPCMTMKSLAQDLEAQLRIEIARSKGVGNAVRTIVSMLKDAAKGPRRGLGFPWIDSEGRQCVCDGYVAFRLRDHLPLPERPEDAGDPIDLNRIFPADLTGYKRLPMPSAKEIREYIAIERAKWQGRPKNFCPLWDFGPHEPTVNAYYLLNAATVFPNAAELFWFTLVNPLVIVCDEGDAVLLPIRVEGKTQEPPATDDERKAIEAEQKRREAISQAHKDHDAAQKEAGEAQVKKQGALIAVEKATDVAEKERHMEAYYKFAEAEGRARLRSHAAINVFDPDYDITPDQFEYLVRLIYVRDYDPHNAA